MTKKELVEEYINGWKENNADRILNTLTENCTIIESHEPTYNRKESISRWINEWAPNQSIVDVWDIASFYEANDLAFIEWNFECTVDGQKHLIEGLSIVKYQDNKISFIREYRTTKQRFLHN